MNSKCPNKNVLKSHLIASAVHNKVECQHAQGKIIYVNIYSTDHVELIREICTLTSD